MKHQTLRINYSKRISFHAFVLLLLLNQNGFSQQFKNSKVLSFEKADSVVVSKIYYRAKESSAPLAKNFVPSKKDSITGELTLPYYKTEKDTIYELSRRKLSTKELITLNNHLQNKKSFSQKGVALQHHYDYEINYYQKGVVFQYVRISSLTNKISISRNGCKSVLDENKQEIDPCLFYGSVTTPLKNYILKLETK
ncbi:hypothetical protein B0A66_18740 [Flavobacterium hercynium]|uniref:Uncharacterized protein n=2 Tax=Flavobacterium hercynium TaxID=387094 RepID=A0A226GWT2_9FLAO|nr:hypothetical protein B0A66_18740 [Flavobacterium hercynium]